MNGQVLERAILFLDSWLLYRYQRTEIPGFVVAIAYRGKIVFKKAYGYANVEQRLPMTTDHIFRIASHSKTFTATSIMQLVEKKLLNIDDPVVRYMPWLDEHHDRRITQISARQLMSHSSGVIRDGLDANYWQLAYPFPNVATFKRELLKADLVIDNNRQMKYSNFGYTLLGCLVAEVSGMPFNDYVMENIVRPLSLSDTGPEFREEVLPKLVTGYARHDLGKQRTPFPDRIVTEAMSSATGFYATALDLCQYFQALFAGSSKLLNDESKKEMQRTQWRLKNSCENEEYGLGFAIDCIGKRRVFGHGGGWPGQNTRTLCDPEEQMVVVVLTNCMESEAKAIGKGIFSTINHFKESTQQADPASIDQLRRFQGRFMWLWGDLEIVESGRSLIAIDPNTWSPFGAAQEIQRLDCIDDVTLRIESAGGYGSEGELVTYNFDHNGAAQSIRYAGFDMLPEAKYNASLVKIKA